MHRVLSTIEARRRAFAEHPLFGHLRDPATPPLARLSFYPCLGHLVMALGDLERHALGVAPRGGDWWFEHAPFGPSDDAPTSELDMRAAWYLDDAGALDLRDPARRAD